MTRRQRRWIQKAIKKKGALTDYVRRKYGMKGFTMSKKTKRLMIKPEILRKLAKRKDRIGKRARLALTLKRLRKR
jgi:hypothetical protein